MVFNKDKPGPKPGADRMNTSHKITRGGKVEQEEKTKIRKTGNMPLVVIMFCLMFSFLYSQFYAIDTTVFNFFEDTARNKMFFGPGYGVITGDSMIDQILTILIRAVFFAAVFGIVPFLTYKYAQSRNTANLNPYRLMWGMTAFTGFVVLLTDSLLWPFAQSILEQFRL